jgi:hypothetical protein
VVIFTHSPDIYGVRWTTLHTWGMADRKGFMKMVEIRRYRDNEV